MVLRKDSYYGGVHLEAACHVQSLNSSLKKLTLTLIKAAGQKVCNFIEIEAKKGLSRLKSKVYTLENMRAHRKPKLWSPHSSRQSPQPEIVWYQGPCKNPANCLLVMQLQLQLECIIELSRSSPTRCLHTTDQGSWVGTQFIFLTQTSYTVLEVGRH